MSFPRDIFQQSAHRLALLELLLERAPGVVVVLDRELRLREANPATAVRVGKTRSDLIGCTWGSLFRCVHVGIDGACGTVERCRSCVVRTSVDAALQEGAASSGVEAKVEVADTAAPITLLLSVAPARVDDQALAVVSAADITAQKAAEEALAEKLARETLLLARLARSQSLLDDAQKLGNVAHWEIDPASGKLSVDEHFLELLGGRRQEGAREAPVEQLIAEYLLPEGMGLASRKLAELMASKADAPEGVEEVRVRAADGSPKTLRMHIQRRNTPVGGQRILGWAQDVTVMRAQEDDRERNKAQFRRLIDRLPGGVYCLEAAPPFRLISASEGLLALLNSAAVSLAAPGRRWTDLIREEDRPRVARAFEKASADGEPYALEYRLEGPGGSTRYVEDWGICTVNEGKRVLDGVVFDVTDSRRADRILTLQRDLAVTTSSARSIDVVFQETIRAAILAADGDCGGIYILEPSGWVRLVESTGLSEQFVALASAYEPGSRQAREIGEGSGFVYTREDLQRLGSPAVREGITCLVGAPAVQDGKVIAWINIGSHTRDDFPEASRVSLQVMAAQFGSSLAAWMARQEYEQILQASIDGLWLLSPTGILLDVNEAYCRLTGWSRQELLGKPIDEYVLRAGCADRLAGMVLGVQKPFESVHRCKDGSSVDVEVTGRFAPRVRGGAVVVVIRDISARLAHERHVRMLSQVVEQNPTGVIITDAAGHIEYVNPKFLSITGYSEGELTGRTPRILHARTQPAEVYRKVYAAVRDAGEWHGEVAIGAKSGSLLWVRASLSGVRGVDGSVTRFVALVEDVTETKAAIEALRVSERRLGVAMEGSRDALWDWNMEDGGVYLSPAWSAMLGFTREELDRGIERFWEDTVHPEDRDRLRAACEECLAGKLERLEARTRLRRKDGAYVTVLARALSPRASPGQPRHFVGTVVDLSEEERIQQQLIDARDQAESASRAKSAFLASMSHEIRTPMNAILGYAQLLLREAGLSDRQRGYVGTILGSGDHLLNLINDVLAMSQIEAGRVKVSNKPFDFWALLSDVERMFREKAESKLLRLEMVRHPTVPRTLVGDEVRIRQIVVNLVGNAIKFTEAGLIAVRAASQPAEGGGLWHELVVTDTGAGMTAEEVARVFQPFEQGRAGAGRHSEGTGLGLSISADYARLLGGDIQVDSYPGMGSTFTFRFPAPLAPAGSSSSSARVRLGGNRIIKLAPAGAGTRALVADDLASNREVLVRMLEGLGFVVREASNGQDAIEIFRNFTPSLVLLDRKMPGLDGYATMRGIRGVVGGRRARVIVVTASAMEEDRVEAIALGADGFVAKPVVEAQLVSEIERVSGLEFIDHGEARVPAPRGSRRAPPLPPAARGSVPPKLASEMRHAAEAGDLDLLLQLIPRLGETQQELQEGLRLSLEQFDYDAVLAWLDRRSEKKP